MAQKSKLDKFGRPLPPQRGKYYTPALTADAVVFRKREDSFHDILLVTRKNYPYAGYLALPGGFVEYNEDPQIGCLRELKEETNLEGKNCQLLCVKGDPQRDPRCKQFLIQAHFKEHTVTVAYMVEVDAKSKPLGGDDAAKAEFYPLQDILKEKQKVKENNILVIIKIAFDHFEIIEESLAKLDKKYITI